MLFRLYLVELLRILFLKSFNEGLLDLYHNQGSIYTLYFTVITMLSNISFLLKTNWLLV